MYGNGAAQSYTPNKAQDVSFAKVGGTAGALRTSNERLANALKQVEEMTAKARNIADAVLGIEGETPAGPPYIETDTIGHIHDLSRNTDRLDRALSDLNYQLNRFQTL